MKVKIICGDPTDWYRFNIGKIYTVYSTNENNFIVKNWDGCPYPDSLSGFIINKKHCQTIDEYRDELIDKIIHENTF